MEAVEILTRKDDQIPEWQFGVSGTTGRSVMQRRLVMRLFGDENCFRKNVCPDNSHVQVSDTFPPATDVCDAQVTSTISSHHIALSAHLCIGGWMLASHRLTPQRKLENNKYRPWSLLDFSILLRTYFPCTEYCFSYCTINMPPLAGEERLVTL